MTLKKEEERRVILKNVWHSVQRSHITLVSYLKVLIFTIMHFPKVLGNKKKHEIIRTIICDIKLLAL